MLGTRGQNLEGPHTFDSYSSSARAMEELTTTLHGPADYNEVTEDIKTDLYRPHFYTERHTYLRDGFHLDMNETRRLLWWQSLAGGVAGFIGYYPWSEYPYPNPEQLRTHRSFWDKRQHQLLSMEQANNLSNGVCLKSNDNTLFILYRENASSIKMDLSSMNGSQNVIFVDCKKSYNGINKGSYSPGNHTLNLSYSSDWL